MIIKWQKLWWQWQFCRHDCQDGSDENDCDYSHHPVDVNDGNNDDDYDDDKGDDNNGDDGDNNDDDSDSFADTIAKMALMKMIATIPIALLMLMMETMMMI